MKLLDWLEDTWTESNWIIRGAATLIAVGAVYSLLLWIFV